MLFGFLIGSVFMLLLWALCGCTVNHSLTPAQIATTRPVTHVLTNIQTVVYHSQQTLEPINILAFVATAIGAGIAMLGLFEADHLLEHIGLVVAVIAGVVAGLSLAGIILLPLAPWVLLAAICGGTAYGANLFIEKFHKGKLVTVPPTPKV